MKSILSLFKSISRLVIAIVKPILFLFRSVWRLVFTLLFIGSLAINVIMFAWSAGAVAIGTAVNAVTGITSVVTDLADSKAKLATSQKQVAKMSNRIATRTRKGRCVMLRVCLLRLFPVLVSLL